MSKTSGGSRSGRGLNLVLLLLFLVALIGLLLLGLQPKATGRPYDSLTTSSTGTRALYLLLEESGFHVARKEVPLSEIEGGVVLCVDPDVYESAIPDIDAFEEAGGRYLHLTPAFDYINQSIEYNDRLYDLFEQLWPSRDATIWFDEYRPAAAPAQELTPLSLLPDWVAAAGWSLLIVLLLLLLFWRRPVGPPKALEEADGVRREVEDVRQLADFMEDSGDYVRAVTLYYEAVRERTRRRDAQVETGLLRFAASSASPSALTKEDRAVLLSLSRRIDALWRTSDHGRNES